MALAAGAVLVAVFLPVSPDAFAATSRHRFEEANASLNGGNGYKTSDNTNATLAWGESYIMMGYMALFRSTGERLFLDRLADHADHVLASRDDLAGMKEYNGKSSPCWLNTKYQPDGEPYCYVVHSGMITYPMAHFAVEVLARPDLWDLLTYDGASYKAKADLYIQRVQETVAFHSFQWKNGPGAGEGHYVFDPNATFLSSPGQEMPLNQQNAMGRTLIMLYKATGKAEYLDKATRLAKRFEAQLKLQEDCYVWNYGGGAYKAPGEDISHAAINVDFARLAGENGIVFTSTDLVRFANTLFDKVYKDSSALYDHVGGTGDLNGSSYKAQCGRWLNLVPYRPEIYSVVRDIYDEYPTSSTSGSVLVGFALLAAWEPPVRPHYFYYVDWADQGDHMQATDQNANILTVPPSPETRALVPVTFASNVAMTLGQWDDVVYHDVARWASTGGEWKTLWLPYTPAYWHPYWQQGALFQFTEGPFQGVKVKKPADMGPPGIDTAELPAATVGKPYEALLSASGTGPLVWHVTEGPADLGIAWDSGKLTWKSVPPPAGEVQVSVRVENDYGPVDKSYTLLVQPADGEPCDDGDPCTTADAWSAGVCVAQPMDCGPAAECVDGVCIDLSGPEPEDVVEPSDVLQPEDVVSPPDALPDVVTEVHEEVLPMPDIQPPPFPDEEADDTMSPHDVPDAGSPDSAGELAVPDQSGAKDSCSGNSCPATDSSLPGSDGIIGTQDSTAGDEVAGGGLDDGDLKKGGKSGGCSAASDSLPTGKAGALLLLAIALSGLLLPWRGGRSGRSR